nr:hypothetical protein [Tanacetum cinerariifolium]
MIRSSTKELFSPLEISKQNFHSKRRLFNTSSLIESNSPEFDQISNIKEQPEEEVRETMTKTIEQYMSKTQGDYGSGVTRRAINQDTQFELKGKFLKELYDNTFSGLEHDDANEHIKKVLEIVDLMHIPKITQDQIMLRAIPVSFTGSTSIWLRNQPSGSITTWEGAIPSKTAADAKVAIQEKAEFSQKWHNETSSRSRSTETFYGLTAIQAQSRMRNKEGDNIDQQGQDSTNGTMETLRILIGDHTWASVSVMPFSTYTNLGLGYFSHTRLTIKLADRTIKQPRVLRKCASRIDKFIFPIDFIILDTPEDDDVTLILG